MLIVILFFRLMLVQLTHGEHSLWVVGKGILIGTHKKICIIIFFNVSLRLCFCLSFTGKSPVRAGGRENSPMGN